jgi:gamma-glutamyl:cysteine ligase YbdK (ATP-grasp superfamily)
MGTGKSYRLFEVSGIELEYMIVDCDTLKVKPIADLLLFGKAGHNNSDVKNGKIGWSNELVNHVIELKTWEPVSRLNGTANDFSRNITEINSELKKYNAMLLPTASHPFMDPVTETMLWQHENKEIYALYDRIFGCNNHGWANLQSVHLNLPFNGDAEFAKLHAAIRLLLPLIPAIAASSPLCEGKLTGWADSRMHAYLRHQKKMPSLMGKLIPEAVFSEDEYYRRIFVPIRHDIEPWDSDHVLDHHFLNSRGAIARFDRGAIEIRVTDLQECPDADMAIASLITETLKLFVNEKYSKFQKQSLLSEDRLYDIFFKVIRDAEKTWIDDKEYLNLFGIKGKKVTAHEIWKQLFNEVKALMQTEESDKIAYILNEGSLSTRIIKKLNGEPAHERIISVYKELADCLKNNEIF